VSIRWEVAFGKQFKSAESGRNRTIYGGDELAKGTKIRDRRNEERHPAPRWRERAKLFPAHDKKTQARVPGLPGVMPFAG
jgi:hypothetical protein